MIIFNTKTFKLFSLEIDTLLKKNFNLTHKLKNIHNIHKSFMFLRCKVSFKK